jgi:hypothetical protein
MRRALRGALGGALFCACAFVSSGQDLSPGEMRRIAPYFRDWELPHAPDGAASRVEQRLPC